MKDPLGLQTKSAFDVLKKEIENRLILEKVYWLLAVYHFLNIFVTTWDLRLPGKVAARTHDSQIPNKIP